MARYISYKENDDNKNWSRVHSTEASKNWWAERDPTLNFEITEEEFKKIKYGIGFHINSSNNLVFITEPDDLTEIQITEEDVTASLQQHIEKMKKHLVNHETPLWSQSDVDYLTAINTSTITWPITTVFKTWNEILEINSISIDTIYEV
tara:strand:+ start:732 stop:1178 length:447 start_codon:yes stop_codon:yes gene_type:complete